MRMPLISRLQFTLSGIGLALGAHLADLSPSHIFNPRWPPHAKFHTGQTLSMSLLLPLLTILFAWRKTSDQREAVFATPPPGNTNSLLRSHTCTEGFSTNFRACSPKGVNGKKIDRVIAGDHD